MKFDKKNPPREFLVGKEEQIVIKDCGSVSLKADEQITFITDLGKEYDVVRKDWGFYATPSINGRLRHFGFKTALVKNRHDKFYVMLVEKEKIDEFEKYLDTEDNYLVSWLGE